MSVDVLFAAMQSIPAVNAVFEQKAVPSSLRDDYRKWLRYLQRRLKDFFNNL